MQTLSKTLIEYLARLTVTQGRAAGGPFPVLNWERRFIRGAFAPGVLESALSVARGNGKTTFTSGLACAALEGPIAVSRGEVVLAASSFEQARIGFTHCLAFLREKYGEDLEDRSIWRIQDSANKAQITNRRNGVILKCVGSDPRRLHGMAPALVLADEPAQWEPSTAEAAMAALRTAAGKVVDSRLIALGTRPSDAEHFFAKMLDGGADYCQVHAASRDDPKFQRRTWLKANPSLRWMPDLERAIRREGTKAKA